MTSTQIPTIRTYRVEGLYDGQTDVTKLSPDDHTAIVIIPFERLIEANPELASVDPTRIVSFPEVNVSSQSITFNTATAALTEEGHQDAYRVVISAYSTASIGSSIPYSTLYFILTVAVLA